MTESVKKEKYLKGKVVSDKNDKTCVVAIERLVTHPKYGKIIKKISKMHVHDPENLAHLGDVVSIKPSRKRSKLKAWELVQIVRSEVQ